MIQEQHADRCRLFAQWKGFDWPILQDSANVLQLEAVPMIVAIDEHGIVRSINPDPDSFADEFLDATFPDDVPTAAVAELTPSRDLGGLREIASQKPTAKNWRKYADGLTVWGGIDRVSDAITAYENALQADSTNADVHFRLGVCYRKRFESRKRDSGDFQNAVDSWDTALRAEPNQYIWRRRIQQYGPRLIKPYPFYDWVSQAEKEIRERGETPVKLAVYPSGAEVAQPERSFEVQPNALTSPDSEGRIRRDIDLISTQVTVVPSMVRPGESVRVHVAFFPNEVRKAHWNNESEPTKLWVDAPEGWKVDRLLLMAPQGNQPESHEVRFMEFEVQAPPVVNVEKAKLDAYALYYVCEGVGGTCLYLRQDVSIEIPIEPKLESKAD